MPRNALKSNMGRVVSTNDAKTSFVDATDTLLTDESGEPLGIDSSTRALIGITYPHHEVHSGAHYYIQGFMTLGLGDDYFVKLVTPDTLKWAHFLWEIQSSDVLETNLYEGASGGMAGGAGVVPVNNNRNSDNESVMVLTAGVTDATSFVKNIDPFKGGTKQAGSGHGRDDEVILKQNTIYLREFLSGANANIISFKASWYEHADK